VIVVRDVGTGFGILGSEIGDPGVFSLYSRRVSSLAFWDL
jgi:hypothetical protein